ncbi:MAG: Ribosomal-protein-S18p-alanine acetyltransferase [uncultured Nocardioidaceae bacterium]|uniref:Ribosomal-protein-S18p-alanine acetyltransferase n=1 Tax=uncultured Nocardioidaceae bacterium TaxID=253824 RepID=A0A6J4MD53_9ACTN|nr:MAG: Ribosomal-protein-S18p-alanine acetyltransferase [uncultured Nocardioidaceae bacterium]
MNLRPATAHDVPDVVALEQALFHGDAWSSATTAEELAGSDRLAVVACAHEGSVVGYAVARRGDDVVDLHRIGVAVRSRRTGIGGLLLEELRRSGRAAGGAWMLLEVSAANDGALAFYAAEGFVEIDRRRRYYRDGSDALVLRGPLDAVASGGSAAGSRAR